MGGLQVVLLLVLLLGFVGAMLWASWYMSDDQQWNRQYRDHGTGKITG